MTKQRVLLLVNGPWQAVAALAALRDRGLNNNNSQFSTVVLDLSRDSDFHSVTARLLRTEVPSIHSVPKSLTPWNLRRAETYVRSQFGAGLADADWVFTFGYHRPASRYFINGARQAQVVIYEEGLRAYVDPTRLAEREYWTAVDALAIFDRHFLRRRIDPTFFARKPEYSLLLDGTLPLPQSVSSCSYRHLDAALVREILELLPAPGVRETTSQCFLIVGQYYSRLKQLSAERELALYTRAARHITQLGYTPVWRGHIREKDELFAALQQACPELRAFEDYVQDAAYPLEFHRRFFTEHCVATASLASSAPFYLNYLYNTPAFTLATAEIEADMTYPHRDTCAFARRHLPALREFRLPNAGEAGATDSAPPDGPSQTW